MVAKIALPRILRIGGGSRRSSGCSSVLGLKSPLIVTDPFLRKRGLERMLSESLSELGELRQLCTDCYEAIWTHLQVACFEPQNHVAREG